MTKERLRRYQALCKEVASLRARVYELESSIGSLKSPTFDGLPSGQAEASSVELAVEALSGLKSKYLQKLAVMCQEQAIIEGAILGLDDYTEQCLLRARYIEGQTWEEVCETIGYSWSQTHRVHAAALQHIIEKAPEA